MVESESEGTRAKVHDAPIGSDADALLLFFEAMLSDVPASAVDDTAASAMRKTATVNRRNDNKDNYYNNYAWKPATER